MKSSREHGDCLWTLSRRVLKVCSGIRQRNPQVLKNTNGICISPGMICFNLSMWLLLSRRAWDCTHLFPCLVAAWTNLTRSLVKWYQKVIIWSRVLWLRCYGGDNDVNVDDEDADGGGGVDDDHGGNGDDMMVAVVMVTMRIVTMMMIMMMRRRRRWWWWWWWRKTIMMTTTMTMMMIMMRFKS